MNRDSIPTAKNELSPSVASTPALAAQAQAKSIPQPEATKGKARPGRDHANRRAVRFGLEVPGAKNVYVVGTFNQWDQQATPLRCVGGSRWFTYISLAVGRYEYRFVVDGKWIDDPGAKAYVPSAKGGRNAVVEVTARNSDS